jgi:SPX domain protein involved in polyphosphate accumulation
VKNINQFNRYEFKYIVDNKIAFEIQNRLKPFLSSDSFANKKNKNSYFVKSLYFDDSRYSSFHDKIDGLHTRHKFRIRTYSNSINGSDIFLENKGRSNNFVLKKRHIIKDKSILKLHGDDLARAISNSKSINPLFSKFFLFYTKKRIKPICLVTYDRRPYYSKFDNSFRITIDSNIRAAKSDNLFNNNVVYHDCLGGKTVIEIKFYQHFPLWFYGIILEYNLKRVSISKICKALESLNLIKDES